MKDIYRDGYMISDPPLDTPFNFFILGDNFSRFLPFNGNFLQSNFIHFAFFDVTPLLPPKWCDIIHCYKHRKN